MTTMGKFRHLSQCATDAGHFVILAIDHRDNLLNDLNRSSDHPLTEAEFAAFKQEVIAALSPEATGLLTDPAYGLGKGIADRAIPGRIGLLAPIEVTDYSLHLSERAVRFIPNWSVEKIKRMGGSGVKLLLPYHPEASDAAGKLAVVEKVVRECQRYDIPFFLEPLTYPLPSNNRLESVELTQITVEMARSFSAMGVDVLKLQFPVDIQQTPDESAWLAACKAVNAACGVPWVLLSAGVDYATFARQARIACQAGASGVIAGRAIWGEAVTLHGADRTRFIRETGVARMRELAALCANAARPWFERVDKPDSTFNWYESYSGFQVE